MANTAYKNTPAPITSHISFEFIHTIVNDKLTTCLKHVYDDHGNVVDTVHEDVGDKLGSWKIDYAFDSSVVKFLGVESNFNIDNDLTVNAIGIYYKIDNPAMCATY